MNETYRNHSYGFVSYALIGLLTVTLPTETPSEQAPRSASSPAYRQQRNSPTSSLTGGQPYTHTTQSSWQTQELTDFLLHSKDISQLGLDHLFSAIQRTYGNVKVDVTIHTDPEEGWAKPVFTVHSGIADFDTVLAMEDEFFYQAESNPTLLNILPSVIVSQA